MGIIEKLVADLADIQTSLSILLERSGLAAGKDKPASEKALEQVASGRRGSSTATAPEAEDKAAPSRRGRSAAPAAEKAADKPKKLTAAQFETLVEASFNVEEVAAYASLNLNKDDYDAIYEDIGKALTPILEYLNVKSVKEVKTVDDQQLVITFLGLVEAAVVADEDMPTVNDVLDAIEANAAPAPEAEEKAPARRTRR